MWLISYTRYMVKPVIDLPIVMLYILLFCCRRK